MGKVQKMILTIDTDKIVKLKQDGKKFLLEAESEEAIVELLKIQEDIALAISEMKETVVEKGLELSPDFTGVRGDRVRVMYRYYGSPYKLDSTMLNSIDERFYTKSVRYSPNSKEVDKFAKEAKKLPLGIVPNVDRAKQVSVTLIGGAQDE